MKRDISVMNYNIEQYKITLGTHMRNLRKLIDKATGKEEGIGGNDLFDTSSSSDDKGGDVDE